MLPGQPLTQWMPCLFFYSCSSLLWGPPGIYSGSPVSIYYTPANPRVNNKAYNRLSMYTTFIAARKRHNCMSRLSLVLLMYPVLYHALLKMKIGRPKTFPAVKLEVKFWQSRPIQNIDVI